MQIVINLERKHAYTFALFTTLLLGGLFAVAFGGNDPSVMGHSALELIVNSTSIVDGSITGTDLASNTVTGTQIDESTLSGTAASLNIGGNAATATTASSASTATFITTAPGCGGNNYVHPDPGSCELTLSTNQAGGGRIKINGAWPGLPPGEAFGGTLCITTSNSVYISPAAC